MSHGWIPNTSVFYYFLRIHNRQLIPLIIVAAVLGGIAFVGYQIYVGANKIRNNAEQRMAKHNSK